MHLKSLTIYEPTCLLTNRCISDLLELPSKFSSQTATEKLYFRYDDNDVKLRIRRFKKPQNPVIFYDLCIIIFCYRDRGQNII